MTKAYNTNKSGSAHPATQVDASRVAPPEVTLSDQALNQLKLIIENDFTLKGKYLRLLISGKGCDGFNYSVGFTDWNQDDILIRPQNIDPHTFDFELIMDPFTAFYLQKCSVDYIEDFANNNEGFVVINKNQKQFSGKFWKKDEQKVPPVFREG